MRLAALASLLLLAACSSMPSVSEQGFLGESSWRHQQAAQDAEIIMQGMNQARMNAQRSMAKQSQPNAVQ